MSIVHWDARNQNATCIQRFTSNVRKERHLKSSSIFWQSSIACKMFLKTTVSQPSSRIQSIQQICAAKRRPKIVRHPLICLYFRVQSWSTLSLQHRTNPQRIFHTNSCLVRKLQYPFTTNAFLGLLNHKYSEWRNCWWNSNGYMIKRKNAEQLWRSSKV